MLKELETFLNQNKIDIALISETYFTSKHNPKLHGYMIYHTSHPDEGGNDESAVIIKQNVNHYPEELFCKKHDQ